jgi:hypothetical protein
MTIKLAVLFWIIPYSLYSFGTPEIEIKPSNSTINELLNIYGETKEFTITEIKQYPLGEYSPIPSHYLEKYRDN